MCIIASREVAENCSSALSVASSVKLRRCDSTDFVPESLLHDAQACVVEISERAERFLFNSLEILRRTEVPVVYYGDVAPMSLRLLATAVSVRSPRGILFRGVNDSRSELGSLVIGILARSVAEAFAMHFSFYGHLSGNVVDAILEMLARPSAFRTASDLARTAGVSRRSFDRALRDVDISASTVMRAVRLAATISCLKGGSSLKAALAFGGYRQGSTFRRHFGGVFPSQSLGSLHRLDPESIAVQLMTECCLEGIRTCSTSHRFGL